MTALEVQEIKEVMRVGIKGPQAQAWMMQQGLPIPAPWHWLCDQGLWLYRLGQNEFVIEGAQSDVRWHALNAAMPHDQSGVYPVKRYDAGWVLSGPDVAQAMAEYCALDWQQETAQQRVCMTEFGGIHATLIQVEAEEELCVRVWCDASYRDYLQQRLTQPH